MTAPARETVHVLCDNGSVMEHDLPLPPGIADRVAKGQLRLVNADGSTIEVEPAPAPVVDSGEVPAGSIAAILAWVGEERGRAQRALDVELSTDKPRKTLVAALEAIAAEPEA